MRLLLAACMLLVPDPDFLLCAPDAPWKVKCPKQQGHYTPAPVITSFWLSRQKFRGSFLLGLRRMILLCPWCGTFDRPPKLWSRPIQEALSQGPLPYRKRSAAEPGLESCPTPSVRWWLVQSCVLDVERSKSILAALRSKHSRAR